MPKRRGGKPMANSSTRMPAPFAVIKWPKSWMSTSKAKKGIAASKYQLIDSYPPIGHARRGRATGLAYLYTLRTRGGGSTTGYTSGILGQFCALCQHLLLCPGTCRQNGIQIGIIYERMHL